MRIPHIVVICIRIQGKNLETLYIVSFRLIYLSVKGSIDISDTFKLLYFVKKMWKYPYDIRVSENCIDPNS